MPCHAGHQHVGGYLIAPGDRGGQVAVDKTGHPEVLGDEKSVLKVGMMDRRRRETVLAQAAGDGHKWRDVLRQMHGLAVRNDRIDRWPVGAPPANSSG